MFIDWMQRWKVLIAFALTMEEISAGQTFFFSTQVKEDLIGEHRSITVSENQLELNEMQVHFCRIVRRRSTWNCERSVFFCESCTRKRKTVQVKRCSSAVKWRKLCRIRINFRFDEIFSSNSGKKTLFSFFSEDTNWYVLLCFKVFFPIASFEICFEKKIRMRRETVRCFIRSWRKIFSLVEFTIDLNTLLASLTTMKLHFSSRQITRSFDEDQFHLDESSSFWRESMKMKTFVN